MKNTMQTHGGILEVMLMMLVVSVMSVMFMAAVLCGMVEGVDGRGLRHRRARLNAAVVVWQRRRRAVLKQWFNASSTIVVRLMQ